MPNNKLIVLLAGAASLCLPGRAVSAKILRAGAYAIDITPRRFPVIVNGMFFERIAQQASDPIHARCLVLDDGTMRIAIAVVDSCMMPRELIDQAKEMAFQRTGIPPKRMLISATHTHSAPSVMGVLGSAADTEYVKYLPGRIAEGIEAAVKNLAPVRIGWTSIDDYEHTYCRRWIYQPGKMLTDPFGNVSVRANMHPGYQNPNAIAPSGPVDPGLSVLSVKSTDGHPIAMLANYSMHYFNSTPVSADYYGLFATYIGKLIGADEKFVAIMSQGTSGDQMWMDYGRPKSDLTLERYAQGVAEYAYRAYQNTRYRDSVPLGMAETTLALRRRVPDSQRLSWARETGARLNGQKPRTQPDVYALEQIYLHEQPERELKLQALRIGDLGITAIPNEVFAISGLKIKAQSPFPAAFNIELANGAEGYIPPPEQHKLGGYTTWPARTAALEVEAEPKIVEGVLKLLEQVSGKPRRHRLETNGPYAQAVLRSKPAAYWRMSELAGPFAADASGNERPASFEDGVAFYLPGPESAGFSGSNINRAAHFGGGRMLGSIRGLAQDCTIEMWFWNGLPPSARSTTGYLLAQGQNPALAIGGTASSAGRLVFGETAGSTQIQTKTWNYVAFVRQADRVAVYLNGRRTPELQSTAPAELSEQIYIGGRNDRESTFEGKIDEVAVFGRALTASEIAGHYQAAGL